MARVDGDPERPQQLGRGAQLDEQTNERTAKLIRETGGGLVGDYLAAFMDEAGIEAKGLAPLDKKLAGIAAIKDKAALSRALGGTVRADVDVLNATEMHTDVQSSITFPRRFPRARAVIS